MGMRKYGKNKKYGDYKTEHRRERNKRRKVALLEKKYAKNKARREAINEKI